MNLNAEEMLRLEELKNDPEVKDLPPLRAHEELMRRGTPDPTITDGVRRAFVAWRESFEKKSEPDTVLRTSEAPVDTFEPTPEDEEEDPDSEEEEEEEEEEEKAGEAPGPVNE